SIVLSLIIIAVLAYFQWIFAVIFTALLIVVVIFVKREERQIEQNIYQYMDNLAYEVDHAGKHVFLQIRSEEHTSELQSRFDLLDLLSFPTRRSSDLVNCSLPDYYCCFGLFSMDFCCDFHSTIDCSRYFCETGRTSD